MATKNKAAAARAILITLGGLGIAVGFIAVQPFALGPVESSSFAIALLLSFLSVSGIKYPTSWDNLSLNVSRYDISNCRSSGADDRWNGRIAAKGSRPESSPTTTISSSWDLVGTQKKCS